LRRWERLGQAKVAVKIDSEDDMLMLQAQAVSLGLCAQVIHDAGRTQIASGSATVLGIGKFCVFSMWRWCANGDFFSR
jgi:peptidyl-tRNA hydrolase, PTH2 family